MVRVDKEQVICRWKAQAECCCDEMNNYRPSWWMAKKVLNVNVRVLEAFGFNVCILNLLLDLRLHVLSHWYHFVLELVHALLKYVKAIERKLPKVFICSVEIIHEDSLHWFYVRHEFRFHLFESIMPVIISFIIALKIQSSLVHFMHQWVCHSFKSVHQVCSVIVKLFMWNLFSHALGIVHQLRKMS